MLYHSMSKIAGNLSQNFKRFVSKLLFSSWRARYLKF